MPGRAAFVLAGLAFSAAPCFALEASWRARCDAGAREPPGPLAFEIAAAARREHEAFGGHVIGPDGRLIRFGAVESEAVAAPFAASRAAPWRHVERYWMALGAFGEGVVAREAPMGEGAARVRQLADLLGRLDRGAGPDREIARQNAIRAAIVDTPWSAAFVGAVMASANVPASRFLPAASHAAYVRAAGRWTLAEAAGAASGPAASHRVCDPRATPIRPGDILCAVRAGEDDGARPRAPAETPAPFAFLSRLAADEASGGPMHCDIATAVDPAGGRATLIGGNVLQSVAERVLRVGPDGVLAAPATPSACPVDEGPNVLCRPEGAPFVALLQLVEEAR